MQTELHQHLLNHGGVSLFTVADTHRKWFSPLLDDKALDEVCEDVWFNHSLRRRSSLSLTAHPPGHGQHWRGRGGGWRRSSSRTWWRRKQNRPH